MQSKTPSIQVFLISFTPALKSQRHLKINYSELSYTTGLVSTNVIVTSDLRTDVPEFTGFFSFETNNQSLHYFIGYRLVLCLSCVLIRSCVVDEIQNCPSFSFIK